MPRLTQKQLFFLSVLLMALVAAYPLMSEPGLLNTRGGGDSPFLLQRLHQLETAVLDGHFPVRWMPDANYGYGYPFFNYYAPLSIYISALFRLVGFSFVRSIQLSQLLGFIVAGWGMFALGKRWFKSDWAGLLVAGAYTVAPFHLVNVYVRGDSLAEFWAMAFYPLVILTAENLLMGKNKRRDTAVFSLSYSALILSHNISAMIFSPFLLVFIGVRGWGSLREGIGDQGLGTGDWGLETGDQYTNTPIYQFTNYQLLIIGILLAFALSAWFFVPALADQDLAQLDTVTEGYFNYNTHFLATEELPLIQDSFFFDYAVKGRKAFRMGLVQGITAVFATLLLMIPSKLPKPQNRFFIVSAILLATFMMLPWSRLLWDELPLLSFSQFPWRFLSIQAFGIALAAGSLATLPKPKWITIGVLLLLFVSSFGRLKTDHLILTDADVTAEKLAQYEWFTGNIGTTVSAEYLPQNVQPRPYTSPWLNNDSRHQFIDLESGVVNGRVTQFSTDKQVWSFTTDKPSLIVLPTLNWPGWQATLNEDPITIQSAPGSGLIMLTLPEGEHTLMLNLTRTPVQRWSELISLLALIGTLFLWQSGNSSQKSAPQKMPITTTTHDNAHDTKLSNLPISQSPNYPITNYQLLITILVLSLTLRLWPPPQLQESNLTWDFAYMGYLHHDSEGTVFDGGAILSAYQYNVESAEAGETIIIELLWEGDVPDTAVSLASPAINRPEFDPSAPSFLTEQAETIEPRKQQVIFELPKNLPAGLIVPRLSLVDQRPTAPSGTSRSTIHLRPILIENPETAVFTQPDVQVSETRLIEPELMQIGLEWHLPTPITQNYNVSLRLTDANGNFLRLADRQPGYGYLPTSNWSPEKTIHDWHLMPLPPQAENHTTPYILVAQLYDVSTNQPFLFRRLGEITPTENDISFAPTQSLTELPEELKEITAVYDNKILLRGYDLTQSDDALQITLAWQSIANSSINYVRFVHLIDPDADPEPLAQSDSFLQNNTYPTSQLPPGRIILETVTLPTENLSRGEYQIAIGFYHIVDESLVGLTAVDEKNDPLPNNRILIDVAVE